MTPCSVDGCENHVAKDGLCSGHYKRKQRGQPVAVQLQAKPSGVERLREAALAYAEADEDDEFARADANLLKAAAAARASAIAELTRRALANLRAQGVRLGGPRKVEPELALRTVEEAGSLKRAAVKLAVSVKTIRRAIKLAQR